MYIAFSSVIGIGDGVIDMTLGVKRACVCWLKHVAQTYNYFVYDFRTTLPSQDKSKMATVGDVFICQANGLNIMTTK